MADWPLVHSDAWCGEFEAATPLGVKPRTKRPAAGEVETRGEQG